MGRVGTSMAMRRPGWLVVAVLALAMRVLIPAGYMVSPTAASPFDLVICTGQGAKVVDAGKDQSPAGDEQGQTHHAPCAFAGLGVAAAPPVLATVEIPFQTATAPGRADLRQGLAPGRGLAAPPPPATGPPELG